MATIHPVSPPRPFNRHLPRKGTGDEPDPASPARRRGLLAGRALAALLNLAGAAGRVRRRPPRAGRRLDRDNGAALHVWRDHGRPVVAGRPGARYAVRLVNNSGERVLAVVAIDGVNVVSGETAGVGQRGYVLEPWQRTEITGWRKSDDEVAAFEFTRWPIRTRRAPAGRRTSA